MPDPQHLRPRPGQRAPLRLRPRRRPTIVVVTMADGSDDPQQIEPLARLVERGVVVAAASRYMPGRPAGRRARSSSAPVPAGRAVALLVRPGRHPRRHQLVQGLRPRLRPGGRHRVRRRLRDRLELVAKARRHRLPGRRAPHDLARPQARPVELPGAGLAAPLPALVPLRLRPEVAREHERVLVSGSAGFIGGYVVAGAARRAATRSSASTTTRSTARSPSPTTTTPSYRLVEGDARDVDLHDRAARRLRPLHRRAPR